MEQSLIYRNNRLFCINKSMLSETANKTHIINALYAAIYCEFAGANKQDKYKNLSYQQRLQKVNEFALNWLRERRLT